MEYVKMPELLSPDVVKTLAGNMGAVKNMLEADAVSPRNGGHGDNDDICCPKKVKFIIFLCNVPIWNINAVAAEDDHHRKA
ncbi:MAG TPA: hypothetical protein VEG39_01405 [Clostridia bacterium]|nr:hypothetical protein [Clostridia bacterium]